MNSALSKSNSLLPREKLQKFGPENLRPFELLAILLGTGTKDCNVLELAKRILSTYPIDRLEAITLEELCVISGINTAKASTILAALQFSKHVFHRHDQFLPIIEDSKDASAFVTTLASLRKEHLMVLYLNARNQLVHQEIISIGVLNGTLIHPREVFEPAIRYLSAYVILAHNHPSGDLVPSDQDLQITRQLVSAGEILGIEVLDHLIIAKSGYFSILNYSQATSVNSNHPHFQNAF